MAEREDRTYDPDPDTREGPSVELPQDAHHFLDGRVIGAYAGSDPFKLDLDEFGVLDLIEDDPFKDDRELPEEG